MLIQSFKDLIVWQKSMKLVKEIYMITSHFPVAEMYGLTSQMRRAAIAIPSNIAEGKKRGTRKDFIQFLRIASGSATELETQILIAQDLYSQIDYKTCLLLLEEVEKMLTTMIKKLELPISSKL